MRLLISLQHAKNLLLVKQTANLHILSLKKQEKRTTSGLWVLTMPYQPRKFSGKMETENKAEE